MASDCSGYVLGGDRETPTPWTSLFIDSSLSHPCEGAFAPWRTPYTMLLPEPKRQGQQIMTTTKDPNTAMPSTSCAQKETDGELNLQMAREIPLKFREENFGEGKGLEFSTRFAV